MSANKLVRNGLSIFTVDDSDDCIRGQFAGTQRVINSFTGERFNHARSVADKEQVLLAGRNRRARQWSDGPPRLISRECEMLLGPGSKRRDRWRRSNETKIELAVIYRRLAGVAFGKKLQHDAVSKIARQRNVCLERDPLALQTRQQIAKPGDS